MQPLERKLKQAAERLGLPLEGVAIGSRRKRFLRCALEQSFYCFLCCEPLEKITAGSPERRWLKVNVDHVFPSQRRRAMRGLKAREIDWTLNLVAVHERCNQRKGMRLPTAEELQRFAELKAVPLEKLLEVLALYEKTLPVDPERPGWAKAARVCPPYIEPGSLLDPAKPLANGQQAASDSLGDSLQCAPL